MQSLLRYPQIVDKYTVSAAPGDYPGPVFVAHNDRVATAYELSIELNVVLPGSADGQSILEQGALQFFAAELSDQQSGRSRPFLATAVIHSVLTCYPAQPGKLFESIDPSGEPVSSAAASRKSSTVTRDFRSVNFNSTSSRL